MRSNPRHRRHTFLDNIGVVAGSNLKPPTSNLLRNPIIRGPRQLCDACPQLTRRPRFLLVCNKSSRRCDPVGWQSLYRYRTRNSTRCRAVSCELCRLHEKVCLSLLDSRPSTEHPLYLTRKSRDATKTPQLEPRSYGHVANTLPSPSLAPANSRVTLPGIADSQLRLCDSGGFPLLVTPPVDPLGPKPGTRYLFSPK